MKDNSNDYNAKEPKVWIFQKLFILNKWKATRWLIILIRLIFVEIAPDIPVSLTKSFTGNNSNKAFTYGYLTTFLFCFIVPLLWTIGNGTFSGVDNDRLYFSNDVTNIILYVFVCPMYVGFGCKLAVITIMGWAEINNYLQDLNSGNTKKKRKITTTPFLVILILGMAFFLTSNYINDVTDLNRIGKIYWFLDTDGRITSLGVYYFLLNFALLMVTLASLAFFMSLFVIVIDVGKVLDSKTQNDEINFETIKTKLAAFTEGYLSAKWIVAMYMINIFLWSASPLGNTSNLEIAAFFLSLIGVVLISIPRYFIELQWQRYKFRIGKIDNNSEDHDDIRPFRAKLVASLLDSFFIGGFILSFWSERIIPKFILDLF